MGRFRMAAVTLIAITLAIAGCSKDRSGTASLRVRTTLPEKVAVSLVSVDRPGTYAGRTRTDFAGAVSFSGVVPGKYTLVYQFSASDHVPTHTPYNYGESQVLEVKPGQNSFDWTSDTGQIERD
jgi:hypothetical protein